MSLSASATAESPVTVLRYFDVVLVVVAAPIMLLIGVSPAGYLIGAGAWIVLRALGVAVEHYATATADASRQIGVRLGYMLGRLFLLALAVILVRKSDGQDAGLTALVVIVVAFTVQLAVSAAGPARGRDEQHAQGPARHRRLLRGRHRAAGRHLRLRPQEQQLPDPERVQAHQLGPPRRASASTARCVYLFIAAILTVVTMVWIARRMHARPNRVQTAVEVLYSLMRDNITRGQHGRLDGPAKWFPFLGALFLFIWFCNLIGYLPLPTNTEETFNVFGAHIPSFALYAATANISVPLVLALVVFVVFNVEGIRAQGPIGYVKSLIPAGVHGPMADLRSARWRSSRPSCG